MGSHSRCKAQSARLHILRIKNVQFETESTTRNILLSNLHTAATAFIPHKHTKEFLDTIAQSLYELLLKAEPDTDAQFAYARYFLHFALSPTHLEKVNNILTQKTQFRVSR